MTNTGMDRCEFNPLHGGWAVGRKPSDDYDYGEPGKWGEPYEMIDFVEGDDDEEEGD